MTSEMPLYGWWGLNRAIFLWLNGVHAPWWDAVMLAVTNTGSARTFPVWIALALLLAWFRPAVIPQLNAVGFATGYLITGLLVLWLKMLADLPRPLAALGRDLVTVVGPAAQGASFPSGHTAFAVLMAAALSPGAPRVVRWGLWIFAAAVGLSRIVVGAHFPADVLGGALLGLAAAIGARVALRSATRLRR
ncbi:MAG: phosphatase PAP2 family protein [Burkholderiales bacterium]